MRRQLAALQTLLLLVLVRPLVVDAAASSKAVVPNAVVVRGRKGLNSAINGVYMRDMSFEFLCYRRGGNGGARGDPVFLYLEGEWRLGPSPELGSVWAFAESGAASPLHIDRPWQVWDGQKVATDPALQVTDASVIPQVLFLSLRGGGDSGDGSPALKGDSRLRMAEGMLLQQPGLWDGRPYYRHGKAPDLYLLCAEHEGRWRLGPLPLDATVPANDSSVLFAHSAAALPPEISEPWYAVVASSSSEGSREKRLLGEGAVRFTSTSPSATHAGEPEPPHIAVEGFLVEGGRANGIFRRDSDLVNFRPAYSKTDSLGTVHIWFDGDWHLGPSSAQGATRVWAFASSAAPSPLTIDAPWRRIEDGDKEERARVADAARVIPTKVHIGGKLYSQHTSLCDARPVYRREAPLANNGVSPNEVFLFYRSREAEWRLGPTIGAATYYAKASGGAELSVAPQADRLVWHARAPSPPSSLGAADYSDEEEVYSGAPHALDSLQGTAWWCVMLALAAGALGHRWVVALGAIRVGKAPRRHGR